MARPTTCARSTPTTTPTATGSLCVGATPKEFRLLAESGHQDLCPNDPNNDADQDGKCDDEDDDVVSWDIRSDNVAGWTFRTPAPTVHRPRSRSRTPARRSACWRSRPSRSTTAWRGSARRTPSRSCSSWSRPSTSAARGSASPTSSRAEAWSSSVNRTPSSRKTRSAPLRTSTTTTSPCRTPAPRR